MAINSGNLFDMTSQKDRGWVRQEKVTNPVLLSAEYSANKIDYPNDAVLEERLVLHCLEEIKYNIYKSGALDVDFETSTYFPDEISCRVNLKLMPVDTTKCIMQHNVFKIHGVEFTEEEVEEAILKAFPYKLV